MLIFLTHQDAQASYNLRLSTCTEIKLDYLLAVHKGPQSIAHETMWHITIVKKKKKNTYMHVYSHTHTCTYPHISTYLYTNTHSYTPTDRDSNTHMSCIYTALSWRPIRICYLYPIFLNCCLHLLLKVTQIQYLHFHLVSDFLPALFLFNYFFLLVIS